MDRDMGVGESWLALRRFYAPRMPGARALSALAAYGFSCEAAIDEYARLTKNTQPPKGDGEAFLKWVAEQGNGDAYFGWLTDLDRRVLGAAGNVTPNDVRTISRITDWSKGELTLLVSRFHDSKAFVLRQVEKKERAASEAAKRRASDPARRPPRPPREE
jgi:hypothetical protein